MRERKRNLVQANWLDRVITFLDPLSGLKRQAARAALSRAGGYGGGYMGAKSNRTTLKEWLASQNDADSDILPDLPKLRNRSRDLIRNNAIASGAIKTKVSNVIGPGLKLRSSIDAEFLGMTPEQEDAWEKSVEREFEMWAKSTFCDTTDVQNFYDLQALAFRSYLENGDVFALLPSVQRTNWPYTLTVQMIEADRVCNANNQMNSEKLSGGVERDDNGAPIRYHILNYHPGNRAMASKREWLKVAKYGPSGRRRVVHLFNRERIGQNRGVPELAPVIEALKQLGEYTEAEADAAVVNAMFAVFIETEAGDGLPPKVTSDQSTPSNTDEEVKLTSGMMVNLKKGEKPHMMAPGRPNSEFGNFVTAFLRYIGMALEIPYEVLIKHFNSSYSASRGALNEAWKYFVAKRQWFSANFCQPIYEEWLFEAVATGQIYAPGFLQDIRIRKAYSGTGWIGPAKGQIDELKEAKAIEQRVNIGVTTLEEETIQLTGRDWESNHVQRAREKKMRLRDGLDEPPKPTSPGPQNLEKEDEEDDDDK